MNLDSFFHKIAEISETDVAKLTLVLPLEKLDGWDSTAAVMFLVYARTECNVDLSGFNLINVTTVGDLYGLLSESVNRHANSN